jgi:hypothetical protein
LASALLFVEKIRQRAALIWFGLRHVGILQIFYSRAIIHKTIVDFPAFLAHGSAAKIAGCVHTSRHLGVFFAEQSEKNFGRQTQENLVSLNPGLRIRIRMVLWIRIL